jgi:hypothetical protein
VQAPPCSCSSFSSLASYSATERVHETLAVPIAGGVGRPCYCCQAASCLCPSPQLMPLSFTREARSGLDARDRSSRSLYRFSRVGVAGCVRRSLKGSHRQGTFADTGLVDVPIT